MYSPRKFAYSTLSLIAIIVSFSFKQSFATTRCGALAENTILNWVIEKISNSNIANGTDISCDEARKISSYEEDLIFITTGRSRGNYTICLSDDKHYPCKHKIAILTGSSSPGKMLEKVFGYNAEKSSVLNETVERLYLKPSSLIR